MEAEYFSAHICCGQMAAWIKMSLGMEQGLGPGDFVLNGDIGVNFCKAPRLEPPQRECGVPVSHVCTSHVSVM